MPATTVQIGADFRITKADYTLRSEAIAQENATFNLDLIGINWFFCNFRVKFMRFAKQRSAAFTRNSAALGAGRGNRLLRSPAVRSFPAASSQTQNESV